MTPSRTLSQINDLIRHLVEVGLADDQQFAFQRRTDVVEVTFANAKHVSDALGGVPYAQVYDDFVRKRVFNVRFPDGALIQMMYTFTGGSLQQHRLAFLPAPQLEPYERDPDSYEEDHIHADIVGRNVLPLPLRFDYDSRDGRHKDLAHPRSHLTLGEYTNCRIPVSAPLAPHRFVDFVLRNFYHTRHRDFTSQLPQFSGAFAVSITDAESNVLHVKVPM